MWHTYGSGLWVSTETKEKSRRLVTYNNYWLNSVWKSIKLRTMSN